MLVTKIGYNVRAPTSLCLREADHKGQRMRRTSSKSVAALLSVLAVLPLSHPAVAASQGLPSVHLNEAVAVKGGTVTGTVWRRDDTPVPDAELQLRDVSTGKVVRTTHGDTSGRFTFQNVTPGSYIVELVDGRENVLALGQMFTIGPVETVVTFIRLGATAPWYHGFFSNAAAAAVAAAAALGVSALGDGGQPASSRS